MYLGVLKYSVHHDAVQDMAVSRYKCDTASITKV